MYCVISMTAEVINADRNSGFHFFHGNKKPNGMKNNTFRIYCIDSCFPSGAPLSHSRKAQNSSGSITRALKRGSLFSSVVHTTKMV